MSKLIASFHNMNMPSPYDESRITMLRVIFVNDFTPYRIDGFHQPTKDTAYQRGHWFTVNTEIKLSDALKWCADAQSEWSK